MKLSPIAQFLVLGAAADKQRTKAVTTKKEELQLRPDPTADFLGSTGREV